MNPETEYKLYLIAKNYLRDSLYRWKYPTEKLSLDEEDNMFDALGDITIEVYKASVDPKSKLKDYVQLRKWDNADTSGLVTDLVKRLDKETYKNFLDVLVFRGQEEKDIVSFFKSMLSFIFSEYQWYED